MPIDPVCGMVVDEEHAYACTTYLGKRYCFCSEECRDEFEENSEDYVEPTPVRGMEEE